jgi:ABC-type branched-subunit amino acid transport system substrate-binding protein
MKKKQIHVWVWYSIAALCLLGVGFGLWYGVTAYYGSTQIHTSSDTTASTTAEDSEIAVADPLPAQVQFALPRSPRVSLVHGEQIVLGTTIAKTGENGAVGQALSDGVFLALNTINTTCGGVWGKKRLSLDQRDDSGVIARAIPHIYDLLSKTPFFFAPAGEIVFEKVYLPLLRKKAVTVFFPAVGMRTGVTPDLPVVWFRPPYTFEVEALLHYAVHTIKKTKISLFVEESSWGIEARNTVEKVLTEKYGLKLCSVASYQPNTVLIQDAITEFKKTRPQVVLCLASGRATYNFIREAINQEQHSVEFLGLSSLASIAPQLKKSRGVRLVTTSVVPNPHKSKLPIVQQYRKYMQQYLPNKGLSTSSLEGFIAGSLFAYFIGLHGPTVTGNDVLATITRIAPRMVFKGLVLQYKEKTVSWSVWLNTGVENIWNEYSNG